MTDNSPDLVDLAGTPAGIPPDVALMFEELSLAVAVRGFSKYSARAVMHRLRWHHHIEKGDRTFKLNNLWSARLSRWFRAKHPRLSKFFEQRDRRDDDV